MEKDIESYLENLLPASSGTADVLEKYAEVNHVPIINRSSMHMINLILQMKQPEKILEVGTAIGYSALRMLEGASKANIVTIEKDTNRYREAITNIKEQRRDNQIEVILGDAAEVMQELAEKNYSMMLFLLMQQKGNIKFILI